MTGAMICSARRSLSFDLSRDERTEGLRMFNFPIFGANGVAPAIASSAPAIASSAPPISPSASASELSVLEANMEESK